ncbi:GNAT family N-acetyltransferase [Candidatus Roizmanbacteria bacterium]|nr:GNAT family N-acetyltransferase [Candidatus Roizmanbacteria bacterium]
MEEGKIVFEGKSDKGKNIIIRYPTKTDLKAMWEYINTLSKERTYITFQGEKLTLEEEEKFLKTHLEKISKNQAVLLLVFHEGKLIGNSGIDLKERVEKHIGVFGITIAKGFRGEGIGVKLMELVISEAEKNLPNLEIITLGVFASNDVAKEMYKKFGFVEYGNLPKGLKLENGYVDHIYMYKTTK